MPGGVNSPVRAFKAVRGTPPFIARGQGARMIDADGRVYVDMMASWGPLIHGHAHPTVIEAVERAARNGTSFGACQPGEVELAERICAAVPSVEMVRLTSSGTEATMAAVRLARAATGRPLIVKFDGCYHGHADPLLGGAGSGVATLELPDALGIPGLVGKLTHILPYNDEQRLRDLFKEHGSEIAAIIVEPVAANMGVVPPQPGYLQAMRELCDESGAVLIFDEVMTGFRVAPGGYQEICGVTPDLTTMGKVIGGGLPVGAFGGKRNLMSKIAPLGGVYHAGTLSGNPLATAAGVATLDLLFADDGAAYRQLATMGSNLENRLAEACRKADIPARIQRIGSMLTLFFNQGAAVTNFDDAKRANGDRFALYFHCMLERGVYLPPSQFEAWFISTVHDDETLEIVATAHTESLAALNT
jgi:glutamate-1-semialdehyde 2,1-aminomutase